MFTQRFRKLLQVADHTRAVRLYFVDNNVLSNLSTRVSKFSANLNVPSRKIVVPIADRQQWKEISERRGKMIFRSCSTETDDDASEQYLSENTQAHNVLMNSRLTNSKTFGIPIKPTIKLSEDEIEQILSKDWQNSRSEEILQDFERLSSTVSLGGEIPNENELGNILRVLSNKLDSLDDERLRFVFQCLWLWKPRFLPRVAAFNNFWHTLDDECNKRLSRWSIDEMILMCDYWYRIRLSRKAKFTMAVVKKLGKKPKRLSPEHFLCFIFILNTCRKPSINMYEVEYALDGMLEKFTVNQLGIVAMAFFKCQTPVRDSKIISRMHLKMMENIDELEDFALSALMKITRYSTGLHELNIFQDLLHKLEPLAPHLSIPCLTNIGHAAAFVQSANPILMAATLDKFENQIDLARIKDLERLSWVLNIFDWDPKTPIFQKIVDSLRDPKREMEMLQYPKVLPTLLCHLSFSNVYPIDLIKQCFDPDFLHRVYDYNPYRISWDFFSLENNIKLDKPEYDGPFLKPNVRDFLSKRFVASQIITNANVRPADRFLLDVVHVCKSVLPSVVVDQVLPHYVKPDIILCLNEANEPVDPEPILSKINAGNIKYVAPEAKNLKWFAIVLATQNQMIRGTNRYVGPIKSKVRQLEKIGYTPIVVSITEWLSLSTLDAKANHLSQRLRPVTDHNVSSVAL